MKNILSIIIGLSLFLGTCHSSLSVAYAETPKDVGSFIIQTSNDGQTACKCKLSSSNSAYEKLSSGYNFSREEVKTDIKDTQLYAFYHDELLPNSSNSFIDDPPNSYLKRQFLFKLRTVELNT